MSHSPVPGKVYDGDSLRVGDIITLRQSKPYDGWLSAEEFLGDCYVKRPINNIEDSLWEVQVQQQYICSQDYDYVFSESMQRTFNEEEVQLLYDLMEAAENEEYLNKKLMAMKTGKPVVFGDVIQLRHKKSQKLLTVSSSTLAKTERENMKVQVLPLGDVNSWLELIPRYKYDHEGQIISEGAEFHLRVRERSSEFIHGAKKPMTSDDSVREVNSSLDSASWTLGIYQHAVPKGKGVTDIFYGHLISLQDIELSSYITVSDEADSDRPRMVVASPPTRLSFVATDCNVGTGTLWMIEQKKFFNGGLVETYMSFSLKHFNTGLFMKLDGENLLAVPDRSEATFFDFVLTQSSDNGTALQEGCSIQLNSQGSWLSMHRLGAERVCVGTKDKTQAIQLVVSAKAVHLFGSDLFMCNECSYRMKIFDKMICSGLLKGNSNSEYIIKALFSVLAQLDGFLNPDDATVVRVFERMGVSLPFLTAKEELTVIRQTILREQGGLDAVISLIKRCNQNKIPDDVAFDRKHLIMLGSVGATDLSRIKPKKRAVEVAEASPQPAKKKISAKFQGAVRSISAVQKMQREARLSGDGNNSPSLKSNINNGVTAFSVDAEDESSNSIDGNSSTNAILLVSKFVGGMLAKRKVFSGLSRVNNSPEATNSESAPRFHFKNIVRSLKVPTATFNASDAANNNEEENELETHDNVQAVQLHALDERQASLDAYLAHFCLKVLLSALLNSRPNQMHLADSIDVILGQVMENPVAVFCVQTMLTGNLPMLQNKIKDKEIQLFLNLVRDNSMNSTFLQLLINTCSCPMGIDATQRVISISMFSAESGGAIDVDTFRSLNTTHDVLLRRARGDRASISLLQKNDIKPIIISLVADNRAILKTVWPEAKLYFPTTKELTSTVMGYDVVSRGVPRLYIIWNEVPEYKMFDIFGYNSRVPIETLCGLLGNIQSEQKKTLAAKPDIFKEIAGRKSSAAGIISVSKAVRKQSTAAASKLKTQNQTEKSALEAKKRAVADYFVAQLYLAAALCLDRNYVAIRILESHYSYENLLSILQTKTVVNEIKAPICSLIHSLYIDREPQVVVKFPRLIRTSVSLGGGDENVLNPAPYKFAVIQHIISDYIRNELDIAHSDELSCEMMNLLASLMTFGFYSSSEQLVDVISPLLQALENHRMEVMLKSDADSAAWEEDKFIASTKLGKQSSRTVKSQNSENSLTRYSMKRGSQSGLPSMKSRISRHSISSDENSDSDDDDDGMVVRMVKGAKKFIFGSPPKSEKGGVLSATGTRRGSMNRNDGNTTRGTLLKAGANTERDRDNRRSSLGLLPAAVNVVADSSTNHSDGRRTSLTLLNGPPPISVPKPEKDVNNVALDHFGFEVYVLDTMQSHTALFFVLSLVVATTVLSILQLTDAVSFSPQAVHGYFIFDLFVSLVFMADLTVRYICISRIQSSLLAFFYDIFNDIDFFIVAVDIVMLSIGGFGSSSYAFTKGLKAIRFVRVSRIVRAARILSRMAKKTALSDEWIAPSRFSRISGLEAKTVTGILKVVALTKQRIQDRQLGIILKAFVAWYEEDHIGAPKDPVSAYRASISSDIGDNLIAKKKFDDILLDVVMYSDEKLVEEALHMLMVHKSEERLLLEATSKIQIISKPEVESKYKVILERLSFLRNTAETFEIWCELSNEDDKKVALSMLDAINEILGYLKVDSSTRMIDCEPQSFPDVEVQQLLVNVDALTTFMMILEALTAESDSPPEIILDIVRKCNDMLYWFVLWNPDNQKLVFKYFDWFMKKIDMGINSARVLRSVLWSNRLLIKECPKHYIADCAQKIISCGQKPDYLDVLVGLTHVVDTGDSGVMNIRNEIAKVITNVERSGIFSKWCASPGSEYYQQRKEAMAPFLNIFPGPEDTDLPSELQYHVNYIYLLSGCKLGPKLQAIYQVDDIVAAIIDKGTIHNVRSALGLLLKQTTEQYAENLDISESMWLFFEFSLQTIYNFKMETNPRSPKLGNPKYRFEKAQWLQFCLEIIAYFFDYFGMASFTQAIAYDSEVYFVQTKRTVPDVQHIINELCLALEELGRNKYLGSKLKSCCALATSSMNAHVDDATAHELQLLLNANPSYVESTTEQSSLTFRRTKIVRRASVSSEIQQAFYRQKFFEYVGAVKNSYNDADLYESAINLLEHVPSVNDHVVSDIRFEPLLLKLMMHIKSQIKTSVISRTLERVSSETTFWLLKTLRLMLQKNLGCTVTDICDPTYRMGPMSPKAHYLQDTMNSNGVTELCLDLIAVGIDQTICVQAAELLVCILARSGGNPKCQMTIYSYLSLTDSSLFFEEIKELIEQQVIWCQRDAESRAECDYSDRVVMPDQIVVLKLFQLMCEGNYQPNKNILHDQDGNTRFINILGSIVEYIKLLSRMESPGCTKAAVRITNTIVFLIQGPCVGNQEYFVLHSDLLAALNRLLRSTRPVSESTRDWDDDIELLKENIIDTLRACIEAQRHGSAVMERVESVTEVNVLNVLILAADDIDDTRRELSSLQAKYLAFLPTLNIKQEFPSHIRKKLSEVIASIEVIWDGDIHHIYFNVPLITQGISGSRKEKLIADIEGANQDEKLKEFMKHAHGMYLEVAHTEWLQKVGIHGILHWENRVAWMMFWNALAINCLFIRFFVVDPQRDEIEDLPTEISLTIHAMSIAQALMCCLTLFFLITIKLPVRYKIARVENKTKLEAYLVAVMEPLLVWYLMHLLVVVLSFYYLNHLLLSLLLLDFIVLDSTNKTILYAVYIPGRLLVTNVIVSVILLQIGACAVFLWYRDQYVHFDVLTMWESFRIAMAYGVRAVEGLGQIMIEVTDDRAFFDVCMYFFVVVLLRNIFFGIIIDTFGELRDSKAEREADAANRCFICGIDRFEYDKRAPHGSVNFMMHRDEVHNMWNYLYFAMKIWKQPQDQDSGIEVHVRKCMTMGDVSWMPVGRIGVFEKEDDVESRVQKPTNDSSNALLSTSHREVSTSKKNSNDDVDDGGMGGGSASEDLEFQFGMITEKLALLSYADSGISGAATVAASPRAHEQQMRSLFSSANSSHGPPSDNAPSAISPTAAMNGAIARSLIENNSNKQVNSGLLHSAAVQEEVKRELADVNRYVLKLKAMLSTISDEVSRMERNPVHFNGSNPVLSPFPSGSAVKPLESHTQKNYGLSKAHVVSNTGHSEGNQDDVGNGHLGVSPDHVGQASRPTVGWAGGAFTRAGPALSPLARAGSHSSNINSAGKDRIQCAVGLQSLNDINDTVDGAEDTD